VPGTVLLETHRWFRRTLADVVLCWAIAHLGQDEGVLGYPELELLDTCWPVRKSKKAWAGRDGGRRMAPYPAKSISIAATDSDFSSLPINHSN
jgi:hypothetical protein